MDSEEELRITFQYWLAYGRGQAEAESFSLESFKCHVITESTIPSRGRSLPVPSWLSGSPGSEWDCSPVQN